MPSTKSEIIDNWMNPDFKFHVNREGNRKEFLLKDSNLGKEYLGACLNYIRWRGQTTVMYELGTLGMIDFIQNWMELNKNDLIWIDRELDKDFKLPYINHDNCPRDKRHKGVIKDKEGKTRCSHKSITNLKPNFIFEGGLYFDELSKTDKLHYSDWSPESYAPGNKELLERYEREEKTEEVEDICYAVLSDKGTILSLEEVLDRINLEPRRKTTYCLSSYNEVGRPCKRLDELDNGEKERYDLSKMCPGHEEENNTTVHPFGGWTLAEYVQKWYEQVPNGEAPFFNKP